jgi:hypothetical protein
LVLRGVCYGNARRLSVGADALEECIAQASRSVFEIPSMTVGFGGNVLACGHNLEATITSQTCYELCVRCGSVTAEHVVKMNDRKSYAQLVAKIFQNAKKRDRIRAARDGHSNPIAR